MKSIRAHYQPLQPSLNYANRKYVVYRESFPAAVLKPFIYCFWELKTEQPLEQPFVYRVVSDGCIDVLWECSAPKQIFITGFSSSYLEFSLGTEFNYLGIRFLPCAFPQLYGISAADFSNKFLSLAEVLPWLSEALSVLAQDENNTDLVNAQASLTHYFSQYLQLHPPAPLDERLLTAMNIIVENHGTIPLKNLQVGLSQRQLRRLFHFYFGASPKTFGTITQFQQFLAAHPSAKNQQEEKDFYDLGYYDQAHFIKAFKKFYGLTPGQVFDSY